MLYRVKSTSYSVTISTHRYRYSQDRIHPFFLNDERFVLYIFVSLSLYFKFIV